MQEAATARPSAMVAILGIDGEDCARELCEACAAGQILKPANFNCPGQIVLSGEVEACERAARRASEFGASGGKMLNVAGAFHSEIMAPAAEKFAEALGGVSFRDPDCEVWANVDAQPYASAADIPRKLLAQLTGGRFL
jgi:[acyl-carrier-protein] S-malonyltransferase